MRRITELFFLVDKVFSQFVLCGLSVVWLEVVLVFSNGYVFFAGDTDDVDFVFLDENLS